MLSPEPLDLPLSLPGFYKFFSAWFLRVAGKTVVVDPGPTSSIPHLITQLKARGCDRIDHLLLTHIHLDHAGGTGTLVNQMPVGNIVCHERAIRHLVDPERLWEGSVATLGELATVQGRPEPVPEALLSATSSLHDGGLHIDLFPSPGHAPHHISFKIEEVLFVGEALGVIVEGYNDYLRPATPPRFLDKPYLDSIERLREVDAHLLCFGHFGSRRRSDDIFATALAQIKCWMETIEENLEVGGADEDFHLKALLKSDSLLASYQSLPRALRTRERQFIGNSIRGIVNFFSSR